MFGKKLPTKGSMLPSSAAFLLKVPMKWYVRNKIRDITIGNPIPPFLTIAPSGAPTKNNKISF